MAGSDWVIDCCVTDIRLDFTKDGTRYRYRNLVNGHATGSVKIRIASCWCNLVACLIVVAFTAPMVYLVHTANGSGSEKRGLYLMVVICFIGPCYLTLVYMMCKICIWNVEKIDQYEDIETVKEFRTESAEVQSVLNKVFMGMGDESQVASVVAEYVGQGGSWVKSDKTLTEIDPRINEHAKQMRNPFADRVWN